MTGKRALVTGSSIGLGESIARALAAERVAVAIHGRDRERAERVAREIVGTGGTAVVIIGDLSRDDDVDGLAAEAKRLLGDVDILVNNAGGSGEKHVWEKTTAADWAAAFDRNVLAAVRITDRLLPAMRAAQWGRVVNVSSVAGLMPASTGPDYSACKAAMNNLTVSLSKATASDGITVNTVSPGTIFTPKLESAFRKMAETNAWADGKSAWREIERAVLPHVVQVPIGKVGTADDVAHVVSFLCSPLAGYITGVNLRVDGGATPTV